MRRVVLILGPPGAGKTTLAHRLGLEVYDRDDPQWRRRDFAHALHELGENPNARAAVVRTGATSWAREQAIDLVHPTEVRILLTPLPECIRRILRRGRATPPVRTQIAAARDWWRRYEPDVATDPAVGGTNSRTW